METDAAPPRARGARTRRRSVRSRDGRGRARDTGKRAPWKIDDRKRVRRGLPMRGIAVPVPEVVRFGDVTVRVEDGEAPVAPRSSDAGHPGGHRSGPPRRAGLDTPTTKRRCRQAYPPLDQSPALVYPQGRE